MKIDDKTILTYFKINNNNKEVEYVLYSKENELNSLYISNVYHTENGFKFIKPHQEDLDKLKKIVQNLISTNPNVFIFTQNKYQFINYVLFANKSISFEEYQKVQLTDVQYSNLLTNKYLKYPFGDVDVIEPSKREFSAENDKKSIIISSIILVLFFGFLIFNIPNFIDIIFKKDLMCLSIATFNLQNIFEITKVIPYFLFQMSVLALILAVISYISEEKHPIIFYLVGIIVIYSISMLYLDSIHILNIKFLHKYIIKTFGIYALVHSIIVTLSYYGAKIVTIAATEYLKVKNFITHYTIFLAAFLFLLIGITLFYNNTLYDDVNRFIVHHVIGGVY